MPGDLTFGPVAGTRKACADEIMELENEYLQNLGGTIRHSFLTGRLALTWRKGDSTGLALFDPREPKKEE